MRLSVMRDVDRVGPWWVLCAALLSLYFMSWWFHLRPGVFSFDSGVYLSEALSGDIDNHRPFLYARFIELTSIGGRALQLSVCAQVAIVVLALSRAFAVAIVSRVSPVWILLCAALVLNPYVANMAFYIENDVLYSFAIIAILVETLWAWRRARATTSACVIVALFSPMAFGFRQNGLLFLPFWLVLLPFVMRRNAWLKFASASVLATGLAYISIVGVNREDRHDMIFPAIIHEIARLARPGYRYDVGGRLSPETRAVVGIDHLGAAASMYWPLYWDTIGFFPDGPRLARLPDKQRDAIVKSFLQHDLFPNLPSVAGHRVEMLLGALLARAEYVDPYTAPQNLPEALRDLKTTVGGMKRGVGLLGRANDASIRNRTWSWNAAFGAVVLAGLTLFAIWRRDRALLLVTCLLWLQTIAVFIAAPSAEYRYVFALYLAPLLLLVSSGEVANVEAGDHRLPRTSQSEL
jgi:hypothetical protein